MANLTRGEISYNDAYIPKVVTGSRAQFQIGGYVIAYASNVSYNENITYEPINVLDKLQVEEHAETGYTVDLQCQNFRVVGQSVKALGIMPKLEQILTQGGMTATIVVGSGNATPTTILRMEGVKLQARQTTVDARGVMTETWSFVGIKSSDESETVVAPVA